jgi:SAM-dependent methyltransferase
MDALFAPTYDEHRGHINPVHAGFVERFTSMVRDSTEVLDAACGTGKYWPALRRAGLRVVGVDHSDGMLTNARAKDPTVPTRRCALQDLAAISEFTGRFDGLLCVDALENVGPEDWPRALNGLHSTLRAGAPAYMTVELPEESDEPGPPDEPHAPLVDGGAGWAAHSLTIGIWIRGSRGR